MKKTIWLTWFAIWVWYIVLTFFLIWVFVVSARAQNTGNWSIDYDLDTSLLDTDIFIFELSPYTAGTTRHATFATIKSSVQDSFDTATEFLAILDDETGTGVPVFNISPTLVTPILGVATATTAAVNNNTTSVATTAYVQTEIDALEVGSIQFSVDGGGAVIATGTQTAKVVVPYACTITKATVLSDVSTNSTVDIWKDSYANYPPTIADTIVAAAKPTLSAAVKSEDSTLTGWTLSVTAGDILYFTIDTNSAATHLDIALTTTR